MSFDASSALSLSFTRNTAGRAERVSEPVVPMYTPMWYATKVMATTANSWWEGGVPPARRRGQRAANAVANAAVGVARRLHVVRS
jgi:hypothetical protein